ncbi:Structural maintenance of chromosomes protein 2 [Haplosporangium bisporale]|nr:Structural maintenance of chromosomes protein 2 [Haplosporangium bisporale]
MRIEELIIDGFKSYATRTSITGWDPEFNAITGLNGSGKSNILDAICFVLGITNWSQVRAGSIQDLIYKRGQAGVTKASVTVVFNNEDREQSPYGFESSKQITVTRQILIGGRSKFLLNGHTAQQQVVQNLFQSVQLNINNPHFLIMQGRITKVLNMKPPEILSMIEEAAGTLAEITQLLAEEIVPKLDKLRGEKRAYLEFQKTQTEIERLSRIVVSFDYSRFEQRHTKAKAELQSKVAMTERLTEEIRQLESAIANIADDIEQIAANRLKEMTQGGKFQTLDTKVKDLSKELVKIRTQRDLKGKEAEEEERNRAGLISTQQETEKLLNEKRKECQKLQVTYSDLKLKHDEQEEQVRMNEELIQTLSTGLAAEEGHENGYMEQLQRVKASAAQATTLVDQSKLKLKHQEIELVEKRKQAATAQKNNKGLSAGLEAIKQNIGSLQDALQRQSFDPEQERELLREKSTQAGTIAKLSEQIESMSRKVSALDFQYSNPTPNFDRSSVKGLVAELFTVRPESSNAASALEICAGGRLYNVVVDNEVIGSQLLERGRLRKRVTIIPLNKITAFKAHAQQLEKDIRVANQDLADNETLIATYRQDRDRLEKEMRSLEKELEQAQVEYEREKAQLTAYDEELKELEALAKQKSITVAESQLELQNLTHETERLSKEKSGLAHAMQELVESHDWIEDQKHLFGQVNGPYDFTTQNPSESRKKLKQLDEKHSAMRNKVNPKVMTMLENQEKREAGLKQMLATVQKDKTKIEDTIASLDDYKNEALERTYSKVNGDFGAIFGDLLPGNDAKLQPLEGQGVTGGLEVKVCLGGVWKASLTELSGGQRSLIALSLILSLLQFKPAPMYILDEVDAALDLSHTQNIGQLLRTRFKGSQFIVVSLKEGMFNNANVLFRARFRDGISIVDRNAQNQRSAPKPSTVSGPSARRTGKENELPSAAASAGSGAEASGSGAGPSTGQVSDAHKKVAKRIKV